MTIVNPSADDALRQIELSGGRLLTGNGRGVPMRRYSMIDSTLLIVAVQSVVIAALLPLEGASRIVVLAAAVVFATVAVVVARRRVRRSKLIRAERAAVIRWLAIHSGLEHRDRLALAWSEPQEIGEHQYEFRTMSRGRMLSLVIDLDVQIASFAVV